MPSQINLRRNNAQPLTITQADQSLDHLSLCEEVTADQQLYTGGDYVTDGVLSLGLPADGNKFSITVRSGNVTFFNGTVNAVSNAILQTGARRTYYKAAGDWTLLQTSSAPDAYLYVAANRTLSVDDRYLWVNTNGSAITMTIPAGFPDGTVFDITRWGDNNLTLSPSGAEGVIDPDTNTPNLDGVVLNFPGDIRIHKQSGHWAYIATQDDSE